MSVVPVHTNENFIKACRDGDLDRYNQLVGQADVNYVSESGECQNLVEAAGNNPHYARSRHQVHSSWDLHRVQSRDNCPQAAGPSGHRREQGDLRVHRPPLRLPEKLRLSHRGDLCQGNPILRPT